MKNKFTCISQACHPLTEGENPGPDPIRSPSQKDVEYRHCKKCGKLHDLTLMNTSTGEVIERIDVCKECLFK